MMTPKAVEAKIALFIKAGHPKSRAVRMAYLDAQNEWGLKYPTVQMPPWLAMGGAKKNPVDKFKRVVIKGDKFFVDSLLMDNGISRIFIEHAGNNLVYDIYAKHINKLSKLLNKYPELEGRFARSIKKNPAQRKSKTVIDPFTGKRVVKKRKPTIKWANFFTVTPDTTDILISGIKYSIYRAFPSPAMADKYAADYEKSGMGKAEVRDLTAKAGRLRYAIFVSETNKNPSRRFKSKVEAEAHLNRRKNPVRPLKKGKYTIYTFVKGVKYWLTDQLTLNSEKKYAQIFKTQDAVIRAAKKIKGSTEYTFFRGLA